jgi:hypothetical protein
MKMKKWVLFAMIGVGMGLSMGSVVAKPKLACCTVVCGSAGCTYHCTDFPGCHD